MGEKIDFGYALNDSDLPYSCLIANECETFGMTYGCACDCPVFVRGECEDCFIENIKMFIKNGDYTQEDAMNAIELYSKKMTEDEKSTLISLASKL